ncbi:MAG: TolB protein [Actinomycetota bacterium]|nr:TolB protein [Actinomycetota bacterium]
MKRGRLAIGVVIAVTTSCLMAVTPKPVAASEVRNGRIAFSYGLQSPGEDLNAHSDVYTVLPDGTGVRQLTHVPADATAALPAWSPSGRKIAYQSTVSGNNEIWTMDADGNHQRQVTNEPAFEHLDPSWSPDGHEIAFERCDKPFGFIASCDIDIVNVDGSGLHRVVGGHRFHVQPAFSPDGHHLVFASDRRGFTAAVWVVKTDGTDLHRLTAPNTMAFWPDWSPDGRILYTDNCCRPHSNVFSVRPDGTGVRRLTNSLPGHDSGFESSSPDGRELVYTSSDAYADNCCNDLVVQHADGSHTTVVKHVPNLIVSDWGPAPRDDAAADAEASGSGETTAAAAPSNETADIPALATVVDDAPATTGGSEPRQSRIAFADFNSHQISTIAPDGSDLQQLTHTDSAHSAAYPEWSPDGRTLAFSFGANFDPFEARIWIVNANGTGAHQLVNDAAGYRDYEPRYTADGRHIVFARCQPGDGVCAIWIVRADGTHARALTPFRVGANEAVDFAPTVSSDGQHVAFTRFGWKGIAAQVYVIRLDGTGEHSVTPAWLEASAADYSPDGHSLTVTSQAPRLGSNVYSLRADGTNLRRLTTTQYPNNDFDPSYSPGGRRIAFASDRRYNDFCCADLFTMHADGDHERRLATGTSNGVVQVTWGAVASAADMRVLAATPSVAPATTPGRRCEVGAPFAGASTCSTIRRSGPGSKHR